MSRLASLRTQALPCIGSSISSVWCWIFAGLFLILGCLFTFFIPPFQVPDEASHWQAAYLRSENLFHPFALPGEHCLYANSLPAQFDVGRIAFHYDQKMSGEPYRTLPKMKRTCDNPSLSYGYVGTYPGLIAARIIARKENQRPDRTLQVFFLSRLFQGLVVCGALLRLLYLIKETRSIIPGITTLCAFILSPLFIQQSFGISADTIMLALSLYLISAILFWRRMNYLDLFCLFLLAVSNGLTKPPQIGVIPAALLAGWMIARTAPEEKHSSDKFKILISLSGIIAVFISAVWMTLQDHRPPSHQVMGRDLDIGRQLNHVLENPWDVFNIFHRSFIHFFDLSLLSGPIGWLDAPVREWTRLYWQIFLKISVYLDCALLAILLIFPRSNKSTLSSRLWCIGGYSLILAASYISAILIIFTMYITWTPVGSEVVHGLQGRYFIPLLMFVPISIGGIVASLKHDSRVPISEASSMRGLALTTRTIAALYGVSLALLYMSTVFTDLVRRWW